MKKEYDTSVGHAMRVAGHNQLGLLDETIEDPVQFCTEINREHPSNDKEEDMFWKFYVGRDWRELA